MIPEVVIIMAPITLYEQWKLRHIKENLQEGENLLCMIGNGITIDFDKDVIKGMGRLEYGIYNIEDTYTTIREDKKIWLVKNDVNGKYYYVFITNEYDNPDNPTSFFKKDYKNNREIGVIFHKDDASV